MSGKQYTIRGIPDELDAVLREEAAQYGKSLNALLVEKITASSAISERPWTNGLEKFIGCMEPDAGFDEVMKDFERVDPGEWE